MRFMPKQKREKQHFLRRKFISWNSAYVVLAMTFSIPAVAADLWCSGWHLVFGGVGSGISVVGISPPFTGQTQLRASINQVCVENCSLVMTGGTMDEAPKLPNGFKVPVFAAPKSFPITMGIGWVDSNGYTQWGQTFIINPDKSYVATWGSSSSSADEQKETGWCTGSL
jgi:hypothetical protein